MNVEQIMQVIGNGL